MNDFLRESFEARTTSFEPSLSNCFEGLGLQRFREALHDMHTDTWGPIMVVAEKRKSPLGQLWLAPGLGEYLIVGTPQHGKNFAALHCLGRDMAAWPMLKRNAHTAEKGRQEAWLFQAGAREKHTHHQLTPILNHPHPLFCNNELWPWPNSQQ